MLYFLSFSIQNNVENLESMFENFILHASGLQQITSVMYLLAYVFLYLSIFSSSQLFSRLIATLYSFTCSMYLPPSHSCLM